MTKTYKDYIYTAKEIVEHLATASAVASAIVIGLKIIGLVTSASAILPLPLIGALFYLLSKVLPVGLSKLKKQILQKDIEKMTELEKEELEELKSIIDDKCSTLHQSARSHRTEPISMTNSLPPCSVYIDREGHEYIRKS